MINSAFGLKPDDKSPQARATRTKSLREFEGLTFIGKIGIEQGKPKDKSNPNGEKWPDKNILAAVVTPDKRDWHPAEQPPPFNGGATPTPPTPPVPAAPINKPSWAP
jgi:hypothetical protein